MIDLSPSSLACATNTPIAEFRCIVAVCSIFRAAPFPSVRMMNDLWSSPGLVTFEILQSSVAHHDAAVRR